MTRPRTLLLAATLLSLAACNDAAPATADAGSLAATPTDAAAATDVAIAADASLAPEDVPAPERFSYVPMGCTHRVRAPLGSTNNSRDDRTTFGAAPDPRDVHVNWPADPSSTIAFLWRTDPGTRATVVQYGTEPHGPRPDGGRQRRHRGPHWQPGDRPRGARLRPQAGHHLPLPGRRRRALERGAALQDGPRARAHGLRRALRRGRRLARRCQPLAPAPGARRWAPMKPDFEVFTGDAVLARARSRARGSSGSRAPRSAWRRCPS
jgi:hypothetical protein